MNNSFEQLSKLLDNILNVSDSDDANFTVALAGS